MHDVAKLAGVSQSTVSRVLSKAPSVVPISDDTAQKVLDAVERLGYYPNLAARSLRNQKTNLVAIMIADLTNPFYHSIIHAVQDIARQRHHDVLIASTDHRYEYEKAFCEAMMRRPVDGIVMVPYHLTEEDIDILINRTGAQIVALAKHINHPRVDAVFVDDGRATYDAVTWLIRQKGHRRVGFIGVSQSHPPGLRRWQAYILAMEAAGLPINPDYIQEGDWSVESGQSAMRMLLELPDPPTAVYVCNDLMAIGALDTAHDMGRGIPGDVAVVGFDNIPAATLIRPKLTTIAQPAGELGRTLSEFLFDRIEGKETGTRRVAEIPSQLIERNST
jgi:LacI family transcriptional regulator/LacI family repressor for deo operon, udp, cdd, tsx, nupC, and nupG